MKKTLLPIVGIVLAIAWNQYQSAELCTKPVGSGEQYSVGNAFLNRLSGVQVKSEGVVKRILKDDIQGSKHQKFIVLLPGQQSVLIAHNIDLAPRIESLALNDVVEFYGEYEWNERGGLIHWTHHDPASKHIHGWLKHKGKTYQ